MDFLLSHKRRQEAGDRRKKNTILPPCSCFLSPFNGDDVRVRFLPSALHTSTVPCRKLLCTKASRSNKWYPGTHSLQSLFFRRSAFRILGRVFPQGGISLRLTFYISFQELVILYHETCSYKLDHSIPKENANSNSSSGIPSSRIPVRAFKFHT